MAGSLASSISPGTTPRSGTSPFLHRCNVEGFLAGQPRVYWISGAIRARNIPPEKGRGRSARKASTEGLRRIMKGNDRAIEGWTQVATSDDILEGKNKAIIYNDKGFVLIKKGSVLHAIEANCTACKFPVIEGKVTEQDSGDLNICCPLCHTEFSLTDGTIVEYCPKDGPVQWFIGTLKEKAKPEAAKVFPARLSNSGRVYVRFARVQAI